MLTDYHATAAADFQVAPPQTIQLRPYQHDAVRSVWRDLKTDQESRPLVVLPTGSGKTHVMADLGRRVADYGHRVLVLSHVKELVAQTAATLPTMSPDLDVGVLSAGLNSRQTDSQVVVAGVQTAINHSAELSNVKLVIVDEAHRISPDGDGQYRTLLDALPDARLVGLTATPYRLRGGMIYGSDDSVFTHVCHETGIGELTDAGFLSPIGYKGSRNAETDTGDLSVRRGEFVASEVDELVNVAQIVDAACAEITRFADARRGALLFCHSVEHGEHVLKVMRELGQNAAAIFGHTPNRERDEIVDDFRNGLIKFLVNVEVLTTGFDATHVDLIALLRPTYSPGLYYQMVGRGLRIHPGKADCLLLDFAQNVQRHGFIHQIEPPTDTRGRRGDAPVKKCPECLSLVHAGCRSCPDCGTTFPRDETPRHSATADVLIEELTVSSVGYFVHQKPGRPPSMRVEYHTGNEVIREWVCFQHAGYPKHRAKLWWFARCRSRFPGSAAEAVERSNILMVPVSIKVARAGKWPEIKSFEFGNKES